MSRLQIYDRRERLLVAAADRLLGGAKLLTRPIRRRTPPDRPRRILLLRLERIGDLLMVLPAIRDLRHHAPDAVVDLVVGTWNRDLARAIREVSRVYSLDADWLAREDTGLPFGGLVRAAARWRHEQYDLAINFEPDIRSNLLVALSGARWTAGYASGGGGALLDVALDFDPRAHTTANARRLVATVFPEPHVDLPACLDLPESARQAAARQLDSATRPLIGVHVSGGRAIKQWPVDRFADVARRLAAATGGTIVLTGGPADRALVDEVKRALPPRQVIDACGEADLLIVAAIVSALDLLVTGDTGPMHLASVVGTPVTAVFGPSDPSRYAPTGTHDRIVRVELPCAPCNRIRLPPERCAGHTPDCLALVSVDMVFAAAWRTLQDSAAAASAPGRRTGS